MTLQDLDSLINLIKSDPELRRQLAACASVAQANELIRAAGYDLSADEILSLRSNLGAQDLSDAELEGVAGGNDKNSNGDTCRNRGCPGG